jgi:AGZA family xanthine/uracil permease-like MFS transporter
MKSFLSWGLARERLANYFEFSRHKTNLRTEILAGVSTFFALSYIFVVNPSILAEAGMSRSAVLFATIVASFVATFFMGLWAKKPFVLAPGLEMNAFVAFFVVATLGFTWQDALGAVFWSGVIFMVLTLSNVRESIIKAIPDKLKSGLALSVGVFLMLIALKISGALVYEGVQVKGVGVLFSPEVFILLFGLLVILTLQKFKIKGAVLISIILASVIANFVGLANVDSASFVISGEMLSALMQLNLAVILDPRIFSVILVLFLIDFYGSIAKFIGLTRNTTIVDKTGTLPKMKETLSVDGLGTIVGSGLGTTSITTYVESGVGIEEGGRTGVTAIVCALLMLSFLAITPLLNLVPLIATTGALLWVGIKLLPSLTELKGYSLLDAVSVFIMAASVVLTFSLDKAMLFGFLIFIAGLAISGRAKQINPYLVASAILLSVGVLFTFFN